MRRTLLITVSGVIFCVLVSSAFTSFMFWNDARNVKIRVAISVLALCTVLGVPLFLFISLKIRELRALTRKLRYLADFDGLTDLLNRRAFKDRLDIFQTKPGSTKGALLLIDIDDFKAVNDRLGHVTGDRVLKDIASCLALSLQDLCETALLGRLGGEEFAIWIPEATRSSALAFSEQLRRAVEAAPFPHPEGEDIRLTISVGVVLSKTAEPFEKLYPIADAKLYDAKLEGRNRVVM